MCASVRYTNLSDSNIRHCLTVNCPRIRGEREREKDYNGSKLLSEHCIMFETS